MALTFSKDEKLEREFADRYGTYLASATAENREVEIDLFERDGLLYAYVAFPTDDGPRDVKVPFYEAILEWAREHDYEDPRLVYAGNLGVL